MRLTLDNFASIGGLVALLVVVAGIIGGSYRLSRNTAVVASYRETAKAWEERASVQAGAGPGPGGPGAALEAERELCKEQITQLQGQMQLLADWATGKQTADAILAGQQHILAQLATVQAEILGQVGDLRTLLRAQAEGGST